MTTEQAVALGRRMMACEGFEWPEGLRSIRVEGGLVRFGIVLMAADGMALWRDDGQWWVPLDSVTPDPRDPGTVGHALAMMRKALGQPSAHIQPLSSRYGPYCSPERYALVIGMKIRALDRPTEAGALVEGWEQAKGLRDMFARHPIESHPDACQGCYLPAESCHCAKVGS